MAGFTAAAAQTTVVGGDGRPAVTVDRSVLDSLGPTPTLPDLLLGKQPANPPSAPVKLHRPTGNPTIAAGKPAASSKSKALASAEPKLKAPKAAKARAKSVAKAEPKPKAQPKTKEIKTADTSSGEPSTPAIDAARKKLASNFEPPPAPPKLPASAANNADMPGGAVEPTPPKPAPAPAKVAAATPAPTPAPAPQKLTADTASSAASTPAPAPPAATPPAPVAKSDTSAPTASSTAKTDQASTKVALMTPPPTTTTTADGAALTIPFAKDGASLSDDARGALVTVAKRALGDTAIQLQVLAYASGDEDNASKARRLSLSRALAVRSFLIDQGVHSTRIEVRALGNKVPDGPPDRVDLVEQKH